MVVERSGFQKEPTRRRSRRRVAVGAVVALAFGVALLGSGVGTASATGIFSWAEDDYTASVVTGPDGILAWLDNASYYGFNALSQSDWIYLSDQLQNVITEYGTITPVFTPDGPLNDFTSADWWLSNNASSLAYLDRQVQYDFPSYGSPTATWQANGTWWVLYAPAMLFANVAANGTATSDWCAQLPQLIEIHQLIHQGLESGTIPTATDTSQLDHLFAYLESTEWGIYFASCPAVYGKMQREPVLHRRHLPPAGVRGHRGRRHRAAGRGGTRHGRPQPRRHTHRLALGKVGTNA